MVTNLTWNEFCELYYPDAKECAQVNIAKQIKKLGGINRLVDTDYVADSAILAALEKTYTGFDAARGNKITAYLATIVHNEVVDILEKENKAAAKQCDIEDLKAAVQKMSDGPSEQTTAMLLKRLKQAIDKLSPSDQVILNHYLEDKSNYVTNASKALGVSDNYVRVRRSRIFEALPKLMEMTGTQYRQIAYEGDNFVFANQYMTSFECITVKSVEPKNPICPSLNTDRMATSLFIALLPF